MTLTKFSLAGKFASEKKLYAKKTAAYIFQFSEAKTHKASRKTIFTSRKTSGARVYFSILFDICFGKNKNKLSENSMTKFYDIQIQIRNLSDTPMLSLTLVHNINHFFRSFHLF